MTIRMGILGFGGMGNWHFHHAPQVDGVQVVSVHDIDPARLAVARENGLKAYESREEFLADPDINFVLVATPNHLHKQFSIESLRAGKHTMCEKPVTVSIADLDEIIAVSKETGRLFTVHQNRRWDRDYQVLCKVIREGMLGKVYSIESKVFGNNAKFHGWRAFPEYGGGMVLDWGVHLMDHFTFLYPDRKIKTVFAQLFSLANPGVDDLFKVEIVFEGGPSVHVQVGTYGLRKPPRFFALGDLGTLTIDDFSGEKGGITVVKHTIDELGNVIITTTAGPTRTMAPWPDECFDKLELPPATKSWTSLYENLVGVLRGTAELIVTPESVRRTMQLIEAVFESAKTGASVAVDL